MRVFCTNFVAETKKQPLRMILRGCFLAFCGVISRSPQGKHLGGEAISLFDLAGELGDLVVYGSPLLHKITNLLVGVHDGGVVTSAKELADLGQREVGDSLIVLTVVETVDNFAEA